MNPTEQKARQTAVARVARRQADLELVLEALAGDIVIDREKLAHSLAGEQANRLELADTVMAAIREDRRALIRLVADQRADVDEAAEKLARAFYAFLKMPFWQRIRWILTGA